jgi:hypothetical protein
MNRWMRIVIIVAASIVIVTQLDIIYRVWFP